MSRNAECHAGAELLIRNTIKGLAVHHRFLIPPTSTLPLHQLCTCQQPPSLPPSLPHLTHYSPSPGSCAPPDRVFFLNTSPPRYFGSSSNTFSRFSIMHFKQYRVVVGSTPETGWDSLARRASTSEWRGDGTCVALVVWLGLISACPGYAPHTHP